MPRTPHRPEQHSAGLRIINKVLLFRVPMQLATQTRADVGQVANRVCANSYVDGTNRFFPGLDRIEEIPLMAPAFSEVNLIRANGRC